MTPQSFPTLWTAVAPAIADHLWQSTLFAGAAAVLTLAVRHNHARVRYGLWLAASMKFLIPFSLLAGIGSLVVPTQTRPATNARLCVVAQEVSQPFAASASPALSAVSSSAPSFAFPRWLPTALASVWLCGLLAILAAWSLRWRRISATTRQATPLLAGREVEALRRIERIAGARRPIELLLSPASLEPGIFGIVRPVLLWPEEISEHLNDAQLEAIVAHEVWHVRRRDNLSAAIHMLVEALFWFHPLVWWLGARLIDERERACDEGVLELGSERQVYAESILKTCQFCVGSPLACASGVTGADLKQRIVRIMTQGVGRQLGFPSQLLLAAAGVLAIAAPIAFGLLNVTPRQSEPQSKSSAPAPLAKETSHPSQMMPAATTSVPVSRPTSPKKKVCRKSVPATKPAPSPEDIPRAER